MTKKEARTPFADREREKAYELLAKACVALEQAKTHAKDCRATVEKLTAAVVNGGYLNDSQISLPIKHPDDVLDERDEPPTWLRSHDEATYHLFVDGAESAHCDAARPKVMVPLGPNVSPTAERLCRACITAPYRTVVEKAKALFAPSTTDIARKAAQKQARSKTPDVVAGNGKHAHPET